MRQHLRIWWCDPVLGGVQVDGLLGRLTSLEAKIRGTEDLINIELDHR